MPELSAPDTSPQSPDAMLPPEVLSLVFFCLYQSWDDRACLPFQVKLSHVCKYWRAVALSTPRLWSHITFFAGSARSESCVHEWLIRSRESPLYIWIVFTRAQAITYELEPTILRLLTSHIHLFRSLVVSAPFEDHLYPLYRVFEFATAPLLEELIIRCARGGFHQPSLGATFNGGLPSLTSAVLPSLQCLPPLTNITDLRIRGLPGSSLPTLSHLTEAVLIPHCLISLSVEVSVSHHYYESLLPEHGQVAVDLPELQYLELAQRNKTVSVHLLNVLRVPKLKYLRLSTVGEHFPDWRETPPHHQRLISVPAPFNLPSLKYLTLDSQLLSTEYLTAYMRIFPSPTHVLFINPQFTSDLPITSYWKESFHAGTSEVAWPNLRVIAFERVFFVVWAVFELVEGCPSVWKVVGDSGLLSHDASKNSRMELYEPEKHGIVDPWRCPACGARRRCNREHDCGLLWAD